MSYLRPAKANYSRAGRNRSPENADAVVWRRTRDLVGTIDAESVPPVLPSGGDLGDTVVELTEATAENAQDQDSVRRDFRLLLKQWLRIGLPPPPGLQHEYEAALATE